MKYFIFVIVQTSFSYFLILSLIQMSHYFFLAKTSHYESIFLMISVLLGTCCFMMLQHGFQFFQILSFSSMIYLFQTFNEGNNSNGKYHKIIGCTISFVIIKIKSFKHFYRSKLASFFSITSHFTWTVKSACSVALIKCQPT